MSNITSTEILSEIEHHLQETQNKLEDIRKMQAEIKELVALINKNSFDLTKNNLI